MERWICAWLCASIVGALTGCKSSVNEEPAGSPNNSGGSTAKASSATAPRGGGSSTPTGVTIGPSCPTSCAALNANCGVVTDVKCGGTVDCGSCPEGESCGAARPNQCGKSGTTCKPNTCDEQNATCGAIGDGCGGLLSCGTCPTGQACGAKTPNRCDVGTGCTPRTCDEIGASCGLQGDGCGAQIACGDCPVGEQCVTLNGKAQCSGKVCKPKTCAELGVECGVTGDGCDGTLNCGNSCVAPKICGGEKPGKCGCTGVCSQIASCPTGKTTSIRGKVYDPAGINPLPNVLVYVPNNPNDADLAPFPTRTANCDVCGATAAGDPLVSTQSGTDGSFTLTNVPVGQGLSLVIQLGRWRRIFKIDVTKACDVNPLPNDGKLTMPKNKGEGDIPRIAVVTGFSDGMECVLWKMGLDNAEFTNPTGSGRVHLYAGSGIDNTGIPGTLGNTRISGPGAVLDKDTPSETTLFVKDAKGNIPLMNYDVLVLSCQGSDFGEQATGTQMLLPVLANYADLVQYGNTGGRIFASHYAYAYLRAGGNANPYRGTANWSVRGAIAATSTASVITDPARNVKGEDFLDWLATPEVGALSSTKNPSLVIRDPRPDVASVVAPSQAWMEIDWDHNSSTPALPLLYSFNTPVSASGSCGRVVFSDFHVSNADNFQTFPTNCGTRSEFVAQEKMLEYMLFDLAACVTPYQPLCKPKTCAEQKIACGKAGDGCGKAIDCGACAEGEICGLQLPGQCGAFTCKPRSCAEQKIECGVTGDGCGDAVDCGPCPAGKTCGAAGFGKCGTASCTPQTCSQQGLECGLAGDGCGARLDCGTCTAPEICGYGGPGKCATPSCVPMTCTEQGVECGVAGDGCGVELNCGNCPTGMVCGLDAPGKCGKPISLL